MSVRRDPRLDGEDPYAMLGAVHRSPSRGAGPDRRVRGGTRIGRSFYPFLAITRSAIKPPPHVRVELVEAFCSIPRAEVLTPSSKDWVQVGDDVADVLVTPRPGSELLHALPDSLHRAPRWPALEEVEALPLLLEQLAAQSLVQVAAEKVEALLAIVELDSSRLVLSGCSSRPRPSGIYRTGLQSDTISTSRVASVPRSANGDSVKTSRTASYV